MYIEFACMCHARRNIYTNNVLCDASATQANADQPTPRILKADCYIFYNELKR